MIFFFNVSGKVAKYFSGSFLKFLAVGYLVQIKTNDVFDIIKEACQLFSDPETPSTSEDLSHYIKKAYQSYVWQFE